MPAGIFDQGHRVVQGPFLEHRPNLDAGLQAVAQLQAAGELHGSLGELLLNVLVDVESARGDAHLTVVAELGGHCDLRPHFGVGIGENDERSVPAQLQAEALDLVGRRRASAACRPRSIR